MKEQFTESELAQLEQELSAARDESYDDDTATRVLEVPLPDVMITSRGFMPDDDLVTETRLRCWELVEKTNFHGALSVVYAVDLTTGFDDTYTATVTVMEGPAFPKLCGLGSDPHEALAHALASGS